MAAHPLLGSQHQPLAAQLVPYHSLPLTLGQARVAGRKIEFGKLDHCAVSKKITYLYQLNAKLINNCEKMNIRRYISLLLLAAFSTATAQEWKNPKITAEGKEPARCPIISYASRNEALLGSLDRSRYFQPMPQNGEWQTSTIGDDKLYSTYFAMPFGWIDREIFLHIEGVRSSYIVEMHGEQIAYSQDGRTPAEFDITKYCKEGRNSFTIRVLGNSIAEQIKHSEQPSSAPYVYVVAQPRVRVRDIVIDTRDDHGSGLFAMGVVLKSHLLNAKDYRIHYELLDPAGKVVSYGHRDLKLDMQREDTVRFLDNISNVMAWSHEAPYLYTAVIKTQYEGRFGEYLVMPVGFRSLQFENGKMSVNEIPVELHAVDFAMTSDIATTAEQLRALRKQGYNALKIKGGPQLDALYELCDRLGFYVINQADVNTSRHSASRRVGGNPSNDPTWEGAYVDRAVGMYHASKNHPSVVAFSIAEQSSNGYCLYESYLAMKRLEQVRPVLYPAAAGEWNSDRLDYVTTPASSLAKSSVAIRQLDTTEFLISNGSELAPVDAVAVYTVRVGRSAVAEGEVKVMVAAGSSRTITVPIDKVKDGKAYTIEVRVEQPDPQYIYVHHVEDTTPQPEQTRVGKVITTVREFFRYTPEAEAAPRTQLASTTVNGAKPKAKK